MLKSASLSLFIGLTLASCVSNNGGPKPTEVSQTAEPPITPVNETKNDKDVCSSVYKTQVGPEGRKADGQPLASGVSESQEDRQQRISNITLFAGTAADTSSQMAYSNILSRLPQGSTALPPLYSNEVQKDVANECKNFASTESFQGMTGGSYACLHKYCVTSTNEKLRARMKVYTDRIN